MRAKYSIIFYILTILTVVAGFILPYSVALVQDRNLKAQIGKRETDIIQLNFPEPINMFDKLRLLSSGYFDIPLTTGVNLSNDEAKKAAAEALNFLSDNGIFLTNLEQPEFELETFLAFSNDGSGTSILLWRCTIIQEFGNRSFLLLDDESGKMVSFYLSQKYADYVNPKITTDYIHQIANTLASYYDFELDDIWLQSSDFGISYYMAIYTDKITGESVMLNIPIRIAPDIIIFNN